MTKLQHKDAVQDSLRWSAIEVTVSSALQITTFVIMAGLIGPANLGLAALALSITMLLVIAITSPFIETIVSHPNLSNEFLDTAFVCSFAFVVVIVVLCWTCAPLVATLFSEPKLEPVFQWVSLTLFGPGLSCCQVARLRRDLQFKPLAIRRTVGLGVGAMVGLAAAYNGFGVWSIVAQHLVTQTVSTTLLWATSSYTPGMNFNLADLRYLHRIGLSVMGAQLSNQINVRRAYGRSRDLLRLYICRVCQLRGTDGDDDQPADQFNNPQCGTASAKGRGRRSCVAATTNICWLPGDIITNHASFCRSSDLCKTDNSCSCGGNLASGDTHRPSILLPCSLASCEKIGFGGVAHDT